MSDKIARVRIDTNSRNNGSPYNAISRGLSGFKVDDAVVVLPETEYDRMKEALASDLAPRPVVYSTNCFLCGAPFRTEHDPLNVPPACNPCRGERGAAGLEGNDR